MTEAPLERRPRRFDRAVNGILLLDKPQGLSSNAALQQARAVFRALKAGHAGSLDPMATGMLPLCFGEATKVCGFLLDSRKSYRFIARLGQRSDTGDADGRIVEESSVPALEAEQVSSVLLANLGAQTQVPPMYSALKHQGERLYAIARRGETIERPPRDIFIEHLTLIRLGQDELEVEVRCSKGTYVRTLAEDIAKQLGTLAHLTALRRTQVDPFAGQAMFTLEELTQWSLSDPDRLEAALLPADLALSQLPAVKLSEAAADALRHGQSTPCAQPLAVGALVRLYRDIGANAGEFLGIGEVQPGGVLHPKRLLAFHS
jgi:tRNA pseudouridine55 synthase